ncbi:uncharacterized protein EAE97_000875 [Botrytis byssoidea]|uniref:Uncharacterized protein n=1 Tax=Botrytis byssoidea TaxID=139641 RepID=A0A9P5IXP8_9HELO|nr:uncharacterized protein EAE97_000875 [Botrytis byssoidea]KAF7953476.1 hypothetical protein EAE97_000875 [Botrytis byssoidea]
MPRKNRAAKPKSEPQSNSPTESEPGAQLCESQTSTQSQSDSYEEDLGPEAQLRESQISTQSCSDSDAVGAEPKVGSPVALIEEVHDILEKQEEALSTYVSPQELASPTRNDELETEGESAPALSDQAAQNYGSRQENSLATEIKTSRSGARMELDVGDDPLHMSSAEEPQNPFLDPPMHAAQTEAIQSEESDSDASLDLNGGGKPMWFARNEVLRKTSRESGSDVSLDLNKGGEPSGLFKDKGSRKTSQGSVNRITNPSTKPPGQFDLESASQNLHSNTESRAESAESAPPSPAAKYYKVETTEMVRSETTRIIRGFQQEKIRIETVLKPDPEIHTLRKKEEELEDHEMMLSTLIDELMIELKKTRGEFKKISRRYRRALADSEKASG